jgi:hypothetical protein
MAIVEEEIHQDPPMAPMDSTLLSISNIMEPLFNFGHTPPDDDLATDLGGIPIEEEIPTKFQQEDLLAANTGDRIIDEEPSTNIHQEDVAHPTNDSPP